MVADGMCMGHFSCTMHEHLCKGLANALVNLQLTLPGVLVIHGITRHAVPLFHPFKSKYFTVKCVGIVCFVMNS